MAGPSLANADAGRQVGRRVTSEGPWQLGPAHLGLGIPRAPAGLGALQGCPSGLGWAPGVGWGQSYSSSAEQGRTWAAVPLPATSPVPGCAPACVLRSGHAPVATATTQTVLRQLCLRPREAGVGAPACPDLVGISRWDSAGWPLTTCPLPHTLHGSVAQPAGQQGQGGPGHRKGVPVWH